MKFPIKRAYDEDGEELPQVGDEKRFLHARNGAHLMTRFQCELCHFRNIYQFEPVMSDIRTQELFCVMQRANLDAMWARETSTVTSNKREAVQISKNAKYYQFPSTTKLMGPFPLEDRCGMRAAVCVLHRSLDPGRYAEFVQFDTFRKVRLTLTNISQARVNGLNESIRAYERNKLWITEVETHSFWFARFMTGILRRVGVDKQQDEVITIDVLHACQKILEVEWRKADTLAYKRVVAESGAWLIGGFCTGLRGEEMLLIEFAGTQKSLQHIRDEKNAHFSFVILGRTKGNRMSGANSKCLVYP